MSAVLTSTTLEDVNSQLAKSEITKIDLYLMLANLVNTNSVKVEDDGSFVIHNSVSDTSLKGKIAAIIIKYNSLPNP